MDVVDVAARGRVTIVTITREEKRNAINADVAAGLDAAFNDFDDDPDQWVAVLTGGPNLFCAGTDLKDGPGRPTERGGEYGVIRRQRAKPLIVAVEGYALGGGMEIVLAADLVVASTSARFGLPEVARGILPTCGGLFRSARALPLNIAKELLLTGDQLSPQRAYELGLVNRLTEPGRALDEALALADRICVNAPVSVRQSMWALEQVVTLTDDAGWDATAEATRVVRATDDFREGRTAFFEKRPPDWVGH